LQRTSQADSGSEVVSRFVMTRTIECVDSELNA
jgi:hypothetical protein